MIFETMKKAAGSIIMPEAMKQRISDNCKKLITNTTEEPNMKTNKKTAFFRKPAAVLAAIALCLCLCAVSAIAASGVRQGYFIDITNSSGAIIGTAYNAAAEEIAIDADVDGDRLTVLVSFACPEKPPYSASEKLSIAEYRIVDADLNTVAEGCTEAADVADGQAEFILPAENLNAGSYRLIITAFTSEKKADQSLNISGSWECGFVK